MYILSLSMSVEQCDSLVSSVHLKIYGIVNIRSPGSKRRLKKSLYQLTGWYQTYNRARLSV